jgi:hypothetical protein
MIKKRYGEEKEEAIEHGSSSDLLPKSKIFYINKRTEIAL